MTAVTFLVAWIMAVAVSLPLLVFSIEVLFGIAKGMRRKIDGAPPKTCILIPAHNEEAIINATLARLKDALPTGASILVVADNCTDNTAEVVRKSGFAVLERFDAKRRGKGYALAHGRSWLTEEPPDCVIIFDADCATDAASLANLARFSVATMSAVQAGYFFEPDLSVSAKVQISNFALWVKNIVRQRGACRLGGGAILTGTGMAFPWRIFAELPLATASIVEDLALTIDLVRAGKAPAYLDQATVYSTAAAEVATLEQRSRWEHGFLGVARSHGWPMLRSGILRMDRKSALLGLHLLVPPLALLLATSFSVVIVLSGLAVLIDNWLPFAVSALALGIAMLSVILAWISGGHRWLKAKAILLVPFYVAWKIPLYLRYALGQTATWIRTDRNPGS
jgi:cellulose synthase/poly-beta-1,6-N-acetylglucosamine synthase-like glycosyltransferase